MYNLCNFGFSTMFSRLFSEKNFNIFFRFFKGNFPESFIDFWLVMCICLLFFFYWIINNCSLTKSAEKDVFKQAINVWILKQGQDWNLDEVLEFLIFEQSFCTFFVFFIDIFCLVLYAKFINNLTHFFLKTVWLCRILFLKCEYDWIF